MGFLIPENFVIPVENATKNDWNHQIFWHSPWGSSGVHKGVDIFASAGRSVLSPTYGIILISGNGKKSGKFVVMLGPKWRLHYFAHLNTIDVGMGDIVFQEDSLGTVGNTGNAQGKPAHLHYAILTALPYIWRIDDDPQGWKKMFCLNPGGQLLENQK